MSHQIVGLGAGGTKLASVWRPRQPYLGPANGAPSPPIARGIDTASQAGRGYVQGCCPGRRNPGPAYEVVANEVAGLRLDLTGLVAMVMDEDVVPDGTRNLRRQVSRLTSSCVR
jgi:hypothetical protein